jgi:hypothetical protein
VILSASLNRFHIVSESDIVPFDLDPVFTPLARAVTAVNTLGNDPLEILRTHLGEQCPALTLDPGRENQMRMPATENDIFQALAALDQGPVVQTVVVRVEATPNTDPAATLPATESSPAPAAKKQTKGAKRTKSDKMSALDAAAKVLAETGQPMTCKEMIETMAKKSYWQSPGGRTPEATLYSAILRELKVKGAKSRFRKTDRGKFARA